MAKFDNSMLFRIILIVLAAFVLFALINYYNAKQVKRESYIDYPKPMEDEDYVRESFAQQVAPEKVEQADAVNPSEEKQNESYRGVDFATEKLPSDCFPKDRLTAADLLPKDAANTTWAAVAPAGQGDLANQNFLTAGYHVGINTVAGSLRNANLQLRSEPPNPVIPNLTPFMNTTIQNLETRRPLEIGGDC